MEYLTLDEIITGMNMNRRQHNIDESQKELARRGCHANYDAYLDKWVLCW